MSLSADWVGAIGTWVSSIIIIVTLWFLWIQIQDTKRSIQSSTYQNVYQIMIDIDRMFIENPELKPYIYSGLESSSTEKQTYDRLLSLAEIFADFFDNVYYQRDCMPPETFKGFSSFMRDIYKCSPILREFLSQREQWYPKEFIEHIKGKSKTSPNSG